MTDKLEALRLAARRLDEAMDAELMSPGPRAKAKVAKAAKDYAEALADLHRISA